MRESRWDTSRVTSHVTSLIIGTPWWVDAAMWAMVATLPLVRTRGKGRRTTAMGSLTGSCLTLHFGGMMHVKYATRGQPLTLAKLVAHYRSFKN